MWLRFLRRFDFDPPAFGGRLTLAHPEGLEARVTRACGEAALKAGAAVRIEPPPSQTAKGKTHAPGAE